MALRRRSAPTPRDLVPLLLTAANLGTSDPKLSQPHVYKAAAADTHCALSSRPQIESAIAGVTKFTECVREGVVF